MQTRKKLNTNVAGFTLVEIMIVVAIIAMLASVAVPSFLRARKRSQATAVKNDLRLIDAAVDQYAIETNKGTSFQPKGPDIAVYLKRGTRLYAASAVTGATTVTDTLGNTVTIPSVDNLPKIHSSTNAALSDVADASFWAPYSTN